MSHPAAQPSFARYAVAMAAVSLCGIAGCATAPPCSTNEATTPSSITVSTPTPVVRYGRYTLVEVTPESTQHDPMAQIVDVSVPTGLPATVGDTLRYVLLRSGYRLCDAIEETATLDAMALPASHYRLGPFALRDALQVLVGPAWHFDTDDFARQVCFRRRASGSPESPSTQPSVTMEGRS